MSDDADVGGHPAVDVAHEADHDFRHGEHLPFAHALERLALVELLVLQRHGVHVVERRVAIDDLERLPGAYADDPRRINASFLIQHDGF